MDPVTILSAASAVGSLIGSLYSTVRFISSSRTKWKDADFAILNLICQLTALKAALDSIAGAVQTAAPQHRELIGAIETCVECCRLLAARIEAQLEALKWDTEGSLKWTSRARMVFGDDICKEYQDLIGRQTDALTLLLITFNRYRSRPLAGCISLE